MNPTPTVSVVIATYNYGHYLAGTLESVIAQTFTDYEVIVVDDGSTDDTPKVIQPYLSDPRIRYHRLEHVGHAKARNHGLRNVLGSFVAFLDSDDLWSPTKLDRQLELFRSNPSLGVIYSRRSAIDRDGRELGVTFPSLHRGSIVEPLLRDNFICFSSAMVRGPVLQEVGEFDESLVHSNDYDLWLRISLRYKFDYVDEKLVKYRVHSSLSRTASRIERRPVIDKITYRFLDEYGGRSVIRPEVLQLAEIERCCRIGWEYRDTSTARAAWWYLQALLKSPFFGPAWRGLATIWWPDAWRGRVRRFLGRPDWRVRKLNV